MPYNLSAVAQWSSPAGWRDVSAEMEMSVLEFIMIAMILCSRTHTHTAWYKRAHRNNFFLFESKNVSDGELFLSAPRLLSYLIIDAVYLIWHNFVEI